MPALSGGLPAFHPPDGQRLEPGHIYVAPPGNHMRVRGDVVQLVRGPKHHHSRPAIDPLFQSAARSWGDRAIGVVMTGLLDDGTCGMQVIKRVGGTCIVQDPAEAEAPRMPGNVLEHLDVDYRVRLDDIAPLLFGLVG